MSYLTVEVEINFRRGMKILLDTCDFLWFISGDAALPARTRQEVQKPGNEVFLTQQ